MWKWIAGYVAAGYLTALLFFVVLGVKHGRDSIPKYGHPRFNEDVVIGLMTMAFWPVTLLMLLLYPLYGVVNVKYLNPFYYLFGLPCGLIGKLIGK